MSQQSSDSEDNGTLVSSPAESRSSNESASAEHTMPDDIWQGLMESAIADLRDRGNDTEPVVPHDLWGELMESATADLRTRHAGSPLQAIPEAPSTAAAPQMPSNNASIDGPSQAALVIWGSSQVDRTQERWEINPTSLDYSPKIPSEAVQETMQFAPSEDSRVKMLPHPIVVVEPGGRNWCFPLDSAPSEARETVTCTGCRTEYRTVSPVKSDIFVCQVDCKPFGAKTLKTKQAAVCCRTTVPDRPENVAGHVLSFGSLRQHTKTLLCRLCTGYELSQRPKHDKIDGGSASGQLKFEFYNWPRS